MPKKSTPGKVVHKSARRTQKPSAADLDRLRGAMKASIDTREIPATERLDPLKRDATGNLPRRRSMIREAVERQRKRRGLSVYALWKKARAIHPTLSQAAVGEFLRGKRELELPSAEALLIASNLRVVRKAAKTRSPKKKAATPPAKKRTR